MKTVTKQDKCTELAAEGWTLGRIARVLGISQRQVIRYLMIASREAEKGRPEKVRKPRPKR